MNGFGQHDIMIFFMVYLLVIGIVLLAGLAGYVLQGIGMYTLGKKRGMNNSWLAFIPYARMYYMGELCGPLEFKEKRIKNTGLWMLLVPIIVQTVLGAIMGVMWVGVMAWSMQTLSSYGGYHSAAQVMEPVSIFLALFCIMAVFIFTFVAAGIQSALNVVVTNQIYERHTDKNYAKVHAVLGLFIPLYTSIYFFIIRNRE